MSIQWYYCHDRVTYGPFSEEHINNLIARKVLLATDLVWPVGRDRKDAAPASAVFDFAPSPAAISPLPYWLTDVANAERKGPRPEPLPNNDMPEWLDDLRLWVGLEIYAPTAPTTEDAASRSNQADQVPDWLQDWLTAEKPAVSPTPPAAAPAIPPATVEKPTPPETENPLVEKMRQTSGFDLETGQILDAAKFAKWKHEQAQTPTGNQAKVSNAGLLEVFRKGRLAIEAWVDAEVNRSCILETSIEKIKRLPAIQHILRDYANYGQAMQTKLMCHLEFIVENRAKYYKAVAIRSSRGS